MQFDRDRALELLRSGSGAGEATFRAGQEEAIRHLVEGRGRLLVVQKTGWGKSFVYFIATKLLRESDYGTALLISPLLALMRNQIAAAERMGVRAATIHSDNQTEWAAIEESVRTGAVDLLLISPERLANERFREQVLAEIANRISLLVVDEAHCISDWGHDFRPHYRLIERIVRTLPPNLRLLATTATANDRVLDDLETVIGPELTVSRGDLSRPSLRLQTIRLPGQAQRLAWLAEQIPQLPGHGIIYTLTRRDTTLVTDWLRSQGVDVRAYSGDTGEARVELEQALLENRLKALVATTALGMGFDKPDIGFVVHYQAPGSVVHYYQEVGRAGRAIDAAYGVLLSGAEDTGITGYFIDSAFPSPAEVEDILAALERSPDGLSVPALMAEVNVTKGRIEKALQLLSLEAPAPVVKEGSRWQLTAARLTDDFWARARRLTDLRRTEQEQMQTYVRLTAGHMEFLIRALDGDPAGYVPPNLAPLATEPDPNRVREASAFVRRTNLPIEPRKRWPSRGLPVLGVSGRIDPELQAKPGRALCYWGDAGWGAYVQQGKYDDGRFSDELVGACVQLLREWNPQPYPEWLTCIPSWRHPDLVPAFAARLAAALGLPFEAVLIDAGHRPEQKTMANSTQQARNVDGSLTCQGARVQTGPVLLVDDIVDSRWTMTVAAWLLRTNGSGPVWPLALASAAGDS